MPFLSWFESDVLHRYALTEDCQVGRDPVACPVSRPQDPSVSRVHAQVVLRDGRWCVQDQASLNGVLIDGLRLAPGELTPLLEGQEIRLGDWTLVFSEGFPGLDGVNFLEGVGDLFSEQPSPEDSRLFLEALRRLHKTAECLLEEGSVNAMFRRILTESLELLGADRGFVVMVDPGGGWRSLHRIGDLEDRQGLSHSVVAYVLAQRTCILSNAPLIDPRFGGASLLELHRGAVLCAPMEIDQTIQGVLYLDRSREGKPFTRFDLVVLQTFVRQGALGLRHIQLAQRAMGQAEAQGEFLRLKARYQRILHPHRRADGHHGFQPALDPELRRKRLRRPRGHPRHQAERLQYLVGTGLQETLLEMLPGDAGVHQPGRRCSRRWSPPGATC